MNTFPFIHSFSVPLIAHVFGLGDETLKAQGEPANSTYIGQRLDLNPQPWGCKANVVNDIMHDAIYIEM